MRLRTALKAAVVSVVAAVPVFGQAAPTGKAAPDFSGIWAHPWLPGFEALASGPTALINLARTKDGTSIQTLAIQSSDGDRAKVAVLQLRLLLERTAAQSLERPDPPGD